MTIANARIWNTNIALGGSIYLWMGSLRSRLYWHDFIWYVWSVQGNFACISSIVKKNMLIFLIAHRRSTKSLASPLKTWRQKHRCWSMLTKARLYQTRFRSCGKIDTINSFNVLYFNMDIITRQQSFAPSSNWRAGFSMDYRRAVLRTLFLFPPYSLTCHRCRWWTVSD